MADFDFLTFELGGLFFFTIFVCLQVWLPVFLKTVFFAGGMVGFMGFILSSRPPSLMIIEWLLWENSSPFRGLNLPLQLSKSPFESLQKSSWLYGEFVHVSPMSRLWLCKALITASPLECIYCIYPPPSNSHHQVLTFLGSWTPRNRDFPLLLVKDRFNLYILVIWDSCSQGNDSDSGFSIHSQFWWNFMTPENSLIHQLGMDDTN